jgi:hypothetical protein
VQWLKDNADPVFGYPGIVRFSWSTAEHAMEKYCLPVQWPSDENQDPQQSKLNFQKEGLAMRALGFKSFDVPFDVDIN